MRKTRCAALVLLATVAPGVALAQAAASGGIDLYGRLDVAVDSVRFSGTPGAPSASARALSTDTSYWGIRGSEKLGAGASAYFKLESGFSVDTGAMGNSSVLFNREAYVGLGNNLGNLQLGSQYTPAFFITAKTDPFQRSSNGAIFNLMQQNGGNGQRGYRLIQDNAIQYVSPDFAGLTARAMYGLSERVIEPKELGEFKALSAEYGKEAFYAGLSYEDQKVASVPAGGAWSQKTYTLGVTYDLRVVKLYGYLLKNAVRNSNDADAYMVGLTYPIGNGTIRTSYSNYEVKNTPGSKASVFALGYTHALSKRTTLYTTYARLDNDSASRFALWPSSKTYGLPAAGQDINGFQVGIRHFF